MNVGTVDKTISEIVREDYRTADVFKRYGINYCCGGNVSLEDACRLQKLDMELVQQDLRNATTTLLLPSTLRFGDWSTDFLVDYIENIHHAYLKDSLPVLQGQIASFVRSHKKKYPSLEKIEDSFSELSSFILDHVQEEEEFIFPYIKQINNTYKRKEVYGNLFVKTLRKPLQQVLQSEHKHIAALLQQLRVATNHYQFGAEACTNHQVVFRKLKELDADLVQHKHLENNILFPKAIAMEKELLRV